MSLRNRTNPNSIYVKGILKFPGYKQLELHCYVDTGSSLCMASKYVIPEEYWQTAEKPLNIKIANGKIIQLTKVCSKLPIRLGGERFLIPTLFQQESGIDLLLGNNFCQLYSPFIQYTDRIYFHLNKQSVIIGKITKAYQYGVKGFLESMKKKYKVNRPEPINITSNQHLFLEEGGSNIEELCYEIQISKFSAIEEMLERVSSENPIDPEKSKQWMTATIELIDPKTIVEVKPMSYSPSDREEFDKQIKEPLDLKVIKPSKSPHMSPAFLVENEAERRRGKKRMVVNYKAMNKATKGDAHNLPNKDELLALVRGKKIYSSFDCKSGFWQVLLDKESQLLTAFTCPQGHYQWNVVPFGLKQAPSIFQRHMQTAFNQHSKYCCVYVDDILVFSNTEEEHYIHVLNILRRCEKLGIILSKKKAQLFKEKINFLGLEIDQGTHCPQNHILEHIHKFPDRIEDKKQLQRSLGILTYASDYIPKLASIRKPLQSKLKEDSTWTWNDTDSQYMAKIKKNLKSFPKLYHPEPNDKLVIETDASEEFWGGILKAIHNSHEYICRYASGSFKAAERNYHSNEKELLAVFRVIYKFSIYLTPCRFLIRSDNKNFTHFVNINLKGDRKQGRLVRWQMWLSQYDFDVEHIAGTKNVFADFLQENTLTNYV
uniref:Enzymatic polyprotein n=2 Tax=Carnation etched ring virus TaxID=10640 RepID=Q5W1F1_CERV|nr:polyprotein [Carnation etched ring virus]